MKLKRKLALLLSMILSFTMVAPTSIFAAGNGLKDGMDKAKITFEYMEYKQEIDRTNPYSQTGLAMLGMMSNAPIVQTAELPTDGFKQNDYILVGFKLSDMDNIQESDYGLNTVKVVLQYDPTILTPEDLSAIKDNFNYRMGMQNTSRLTNQSYAHEILSPELSMVKDGWKAITLKLSVPNSVASPAYKGATDEYIGFIEFQVTGTPPENGASVLESVRESDQNIISFGQSGDYGSYEGLHPSGNTFDVIDFDDSVGGKIFPQSYTVTYEAGTGASYKPADDGGTFDNTESVEATKTDTTDNKNYGNPTLKNKAGNLIEDYLVPPTGKIFKEWQTTDGIKFDTSSLVKEDITVTAVYDDGYNVNFNLNAADATYADGKTDLKSITLGKTETPAANAIADTVGGDPIRSGYTFKGWYTKKNGAFDKKYTDDGAAGTTAITAITGQTDLYAMWDNAGAGDYKLNFNSNRADGATGTDADPSVVGYNDNTPADTLASVIGGLPTEPTTSQDGYKFIGWYKNQAGDGEKLTAGTELLGYTGATAASPETTVYAKWGYVDEPNPDNPDDPNPNTNTVIITFPKDGDGTYNGGTSDNGTLNDRYIKYGETVPNLPTAMTRSGKGFGGWYTMRQNDDGSIPDGAIKVEANTAIDSNFGVDAANGGTVSLYAYWIDKVTISYDMNGSPTGTKPADSDPLVPGADFTPATVTDFDETNYTFKEWNTEKNGSGTSYTAGTKTTAPDKNTTLYAIWDYEATKSDAVSVTFDGNDTTQFPATLKPNNGTSDTNKYTIVRQAGETISPDHMPKATRSTAGTDDNKYTLNHWDTNKTAAAGTQPTITVAADEGTQTMNVYAIWTVTNDADKATVTFKKLSTDTDAYATVVIAKGDTVGPQMPVNPTRDDGYTFSKWLKGTDEFKADTVVSDATTDVVGDWTQEIQLAYDKNGMPDAVTVPDTVKGAPNDKKTVGNITANGVAVELVEWNTEPNGSGTAYQPDAEVTLGTENITLYAIWNSTDPDAKTITFHANDSTTYKAKLNGVEQKTVTMMRAAGQKITAAQMPKAEREKYTLDHWGKTALEATGTATEEITVGNDNIDRYAIWKVADGETPYNVTFNLHDKATPTEIGPIAVVSGDSLGDRMPANPTREKYTYEKWTTGAAKTDFDSTTQITGATTVDANWSIKVDVKFTQSEYDYDGTQHTPIATGNYVIFPKGENTGALTGLTLSTDKYLKVTGKTTDNPPVYTTAELTNDEGVLVDGVLVPKNGGEYKFGTLTLTETSGDGFTTYDINTIPATFKIKAKPVELTIGNNYQYIGSGESIADITVSADDTNVSTALTGGDIKVTFTDKDSNKTTTMPTAFGHYTVKIESTNDNYSVKTVKDNYTHTGDAIPLYLINLQRQVKVDYMGGTNKNASDVYATVTLAKPATPSDTSSAKTTLAGQTTALDVPQSGTDFDPPQGKRIKKFVTGTKTGNTITDQVDFDKDTVIPFSETNEALTIYAIYENADWKLTFSDTKTNPAAETFDAYTVGAEKSVKDGLSKKGETAVTNPDDKTLPVPTAAPANMMFKGWTTEESIANEANLTSADFETVEGVDGKYKGKLFTDDTVPTAAQLGDSNEITVYAVYVKSSDATLKSALFKEVLVPKNADGTPSGAPDEVKADLSYVDDLINPTSGTTITFDPDTDTYNIIVKNDFEKVLADLEPAQSDATVAVKVNNNAVTNETTGVPAGHTQAKPGVDATVYNSADSTNSTNTIVVTVTAPDGKTTKDYTFNVLRYAKAEIKLNYGNSPYGEIMKTTWDDSKKAAAKAAFNVANKYGKDDEGNLLIPPQAADKTQLYHMRAWVDIAANNITSLNSLTADEQAKLADPNINMDRNETAIFIYNGEAFVDPGFVAVDSYGKPVTNLDRQIKVRRMTGQTNWQLIADNKLQGEETIDISNQPSNALITSVTKPVVLDSQKKLVLNTAPIRPDIYEMKYSFEDEQEGPVEVTRKVVILQPEGDANFSDTFNDNDFIPINAWMLDQSQFSTLVTTDTARRIYLYKTLDINYTETINDNDFIPLNSYMLDSSRVIPSSYVKLPSTLPGN